MKIKNTTLDDILHKNSGINFTADAYSPIDGNSLGSLADDQLFTLLSSGSLVLNDGVNDIPSPSDAWNAINKIVPQNLLVTTQFELNNKDLKLAKGTANVDGTNTATISIKIPGTFGSTDGRYVAGGYGISSDYRPDDYMAVRIEDTERLIAMALAQASDPNATEPVSDDTVQGMGSIPGFGAFPSYPIVKSYTDDELSPENQGWFFWPLAQGNSLPPVGECEVEPIGGYGFLPAGFYIKATFYRSVSTGSVQVNFYWGKLE